MVALSDDVAVTGATTVRGVEVRERSPWGVFALVLLTLGLYYVVWYYRVNDEVRRFGEATGVRPNPLRVRPIVSVLAVTLGGFLIVPAVVSPYRTAARIRRAQELSGTEHRLNPVLALSLYLCGLMLIPVECVYAQRHLNSVWAHERAEAEKASLGMRGPVAAVAVPTPAPRRRRSTSRQSSSRRRLSRGRSQLRSRRSREAWAAVQPRRPTSPPSAIWR